MAESTDYIHWAEDSAEVRMRNEIQGFRNSAFSPFHPYYVGRMAGPSLRNRFFNHVIKRWKRVNKNENIARLNSSYAALTRTLGDMEHKLPPGHVETGCYVRGCGR